jgi:hypothetical protein
VPNTISNRSCGFGYGKRMSFEKKSKLNKDFSYLFITDDFSPPPNNYNLKSDFHETSPAGKAFSFGITREAYKKVGSFIFMFEKVCVRDAPNRDETVPGPGQYNHQHLTGNEGRRYSLRPRTSNPSEIKILNPSVQEYKITQKQPWARQV